MLVACGLDSGGALILVMMIVASYGMGRLSIPREARRR
jgi:hypothetical protein